MHKGTTATREVGIDRDRVARAYKVIQPYIRRTPVVEADGQDFGLPSGHTVFKLESLQHSGSFKARRAFANLLLREIPKAGVVAASGGNHGAAVGYAAMKQHWGANRRSRVREQYHRGRLQEVKLNSLVAWAHTSFAAITIIL